MVLPNVFSFLSMISSGSSMLSDGTGAAASGASFLQYLLQLFPH